MTFLSYIRRFTNYSNIQRDIKRCSFDQPGDRLKKTTGLVETSSLYILTLKIMRIELNSLYVLLRVFQISCTKKTIVIPHTKGLKFNFAQHGTETGKENFIFSSTNPEIENSIHKIL